MANAEHSMNNMDTENQRLLDHVQKVCEGLHKLQQNRTLCDITIKVGDASFEAHKAVLASSSDFFYTMFTSGFQESHASEVSITGKPEAFQILLDFSYSGKLDVPSDEATAVIDVLKMAHYLQYNLIVVRCEEVLLRIFRQFKMKDVLQMISDSDVFGLGKLKTRCKQYLAQNFEGSEEFLQCMTSELIVETLNHKDFNVMDEKKVFDIIVAWLKHDWEGRKEFAPCLLKAMRLGAVPVFHLNMTFLQMPELNTIPECPQMVIRVMQLLDSKKPNDPPLSMSHPALFETRSTVTAIISVEDGSLRFFDVGWKIMTKLPALPKKDFSDSSDNCVVVNNAQLYVARGTQQGTRRLRHPQFLSLDVVNKKWTPLAAMTQRREMCSLVSLGNRHIYAIGGVCRGVCIKKCEVYIIDEDRWHEIAPMPHPVCSKSAVVHEDKILVYGDQDIDYAYINNRFKLMMYNPTVNTWHVLDTFEHDTNGCVFTSGLVVQNGRCYRVAGDEDAGFVVHEVIIDHNNRFCTSGNDQRQGQDAIPSNFKDKGLFCIDQVVYEVRLHGYFKMDDIVPEALNQMTDTYMMSRMQNVYGVRDTECVATFRFDKALLV
ncbi:kelch-like protein 25 [Amphiura filiformis]|uniref:kelch-like protein 25 n=1 Tax=Amphiura filiformis TaxID=82378 RepID=UPI003B2256AE